MDAAQREENENGGGDPQDIGDMANDGGNDDPQNEDEQSEDENELPDAMYDPKDDVYRCVECGTEVVDGTCQGCWTKYDWTEVYHYSLHMCFKPSNILLIIYRPYRKWV